MITVALIAYFLALKSHFQLEGHSLNPTSFSTAHFLGMYPSNLKRNPSSVKFPQLEHLQLYQRLQQHYSQYFE